MIILLIFNIFLLSASQQAVSQQDFCIMECFRTMFSSRSVRGASESLPPLPLHPVHCYAVFTNGDQVIDSRGFYDTGPQQEPSDKIELKKMFNG